MSEPGEAIGVLVVDDESDMRALVQAVIELANHGLRVVGQAASGEEAIEAWREKKPDAVVLDLRMPGMSGLEAAERILAERPEQCIILFSAFLDEPTVNKASKLGIRRWIAKDEVSSIPAALWSCAPA